MGIFLLIYILHLANASLNHIHFQSLIEFVSNRETFSFDENEEKIHLWNHFKNQNSGGYFVYYSIGQEVPENLKQIIKDFATEINSNSCLVFSDVLVQERYDENFSSKTYEIIKIIKLNIIFI